VTMMGELGCCRVIAKFTLDFVRVIDPGAFDL
jgi:hypothetical protein